MKIDELRKIFLDNIQSSLASYHPRIEGGEGEIETYNFVKGTIIASAFYLIKICGAGIDVCDDALEELEKMRSGKQNYSVAEILSRLEEKAKSKEGMKDGT